MNKTKLFSLISLLLINFNLNAANTPKNVSILNINDTKIHTFHGISNSHIIETSKSLYMVDSQMLFKHADQLKQYVQSLDKPLNSIILSHNHPDHWFGSEKFKGLAPFATSQNVSNDLKNGGGRYIKILNKKLKGQLPSEVIIPDQILTLGAHRWDDLRVIIEETSEQESHHSLVIKIPSLGVIIGQDLIYNNMFLVASERERNQHWIKILKDFKRAYSKVYPHVLTGHGDNGGPELYQQNIDYLNSLEMVMKLNLSQEVTTAKLIAQYPNRGGKGMLKISMRNMFSKGH